MPNDATLDGAGHTITAVEDAAHRNFQGSVLASAVGNDDAAARPGCQEPGHHDPGLPEREQQRRSAERHLHVPRRREPDQRLRGRHLPRQRRPGGQRDLDPQPSLGRQHQRAARPRRPDRHRRHELPEDRSAPRRQPHLLGQERERRPRQGPAGSARTRALRPTRCRSPAVPPAPSPTARSRSTPCSRRGPSTRLREPPCCCSTPRTSPSRRSASTAPPRRDQGIVISNNNKTPVDTVFTMRGGAVTRTATPTGGIGLTCRGTCGLRHRHGHRHHVHGLGLGDQRVPSR